MDDDYYNTLGISRSASAAEIQKAYRTLARKFHPDTNPDDASLKAKFQKIQRAYEVLNDPKKRELYDRYGAAFDTMGAGGGPGGGPGGASYTWSGGPGEEFDFGQFFGEKFGAGAGAGGGGAGAGGFSDFFKMFRGGAEPGGSYQTKAGPRKGEDLHYEITIPFATAVTGGEVELQLRRRQGTTEAISVKIPVGMEDGKKIRLRGQGEPAGKRGAAGDLIVTVHVASHPHYARRGSHLDVKVPVTLAEAAAGAKIDVPTPKGTVTLTIPPGTSSGAKLRIKGYGVAAGDGPPGDLYAEIMIVIPKSLDAASLEFVQQFQQRNPADPRRDLRW